MLLGRTTTLCVALMPTIQGLVTRGSFHTLLDKTPMPSLLWLAHLEETSASLEDTATVLSPYMRVRLYPLEDSFGPQPMLEEAKPIVERLYRQYQVMQQSANNFGVRIGALKVCTSVALPPPR